jgi:glutamate formiminotransferase/formiminotetrahydrofolate cyclodeaminase
MRKLVECVPNFSEGRRPEVIEAIVNEIRNLSGVFLLGKEMDADHNRAVITIVGEPEAVKEAMFRMIKKASERIDLTIHTGEHPRIGATDVVPFIPIENMTMEGCVQLARELGQQVGDELQIPVYLYEAAATRPERKNLANVRKGQFEGLRKEIGINPDRVPDYGPAHIHSTAGATAIGARFFLIAYNVNLDSQDVALAKRIAKKVRESSGGFPCVKALGLELKEKNIVQVSMNMTNYTVTSLATVYAAIQKEAKKAGVSVLESELIGFVPREALTDAAIEFLKLRNFDNNQILENRIAQVVDEPTPGPSQEGKHPNEDFLEAFASRNPTPGGGSASALAGTLAGALVRMVCNLTVGKKKYQDVAAQLNAVQEQARQLQNRLRELIAEDSQAYNTVLSAFRLPREIDEEKAARKTAIQDALKIAASTPLEVMRNALEVLKLTKTLAEKGNPNAITDLGCAVHLANAAIAGSELNVRINLGSIVDHEFTKRMEAEIVQIRKATKKLSQEVLTIVESKI